MANLAKTLNPLHKNLREAFKSHADPQVIIAHFLNLHGILHSKIVAPKAPWSYEDDLLNDLDEEGFRRIPKNREHSVVWVVWHLSRIEDVVMNILVADRDQVFEEGHWQAKTRSPIKHTCNGTGMAVTASISKAIDISALREYRCAVGQATREIVPSLTWDDFKRKPEPAQLQRILDEGAVLPVGMGTIDYWASRDVAGLLLMPPTRHTIIHWNEARELISRKE
jgi:hypothetical protein